MNTLLDNSELNDSLINKIDMLLGNWYETTTTDFQKSLLFYKFLFNLDYQLNEWSNTLFNALEAIGFKTDKRLSFNFIFKQEVSWDEMTDYYSIGRNGDSSRKFGQGGQFSNNQIDYLVLTLFDRNKSMVQL